jgi:hypothetical protein
MEFIITKDYFLKHMNITIITNYTKWKLHAKDNKVLGLSKLGLGFEEVISSKLN